MNDLREEITSLPAEFKSYIFQDSWQKNKATFVLFEEQTTK